MDTSNPGTLAVLIAVDIIVALAAIGWHLYQKARTRKLQQRFGDEYSRTVTVMGNRSKAEAELDARQRRVEKLQIIALAPEEAARFDRAWRALQARFVDNPRGALVEADQLVRELMARRGYPMTNFEHRAADISVDHPHVVENFRAAQDIALRDRQAAVSTEELRRAVVHYRALFQDLLEVDEPELQHHHRTAEVRS